MTSINIDIPGYPLRTEGPSKQNDRYDIICPGLSKDEEGKAENPELQLLSPFQMGSSQEEEKNAENCRCPTGTSLP